MDTVTEGGVVLADYDWDTLSRRDLVKLNANAFNMDPAYEADDDLLSLAHTGPSPLTFTFGRNHSGQITSLTASDGAFLSRPSTTQSTAYVPNRLNQYSSVGGTAHGYDANGNLTSDGTYTYEYDEENRLRSAVGGGFTTSYEYDPLGRRRAKVVNGVTTKFVSDNAEEIEERNSSNIVLRKYVYGSSIDERIAMLEATACTGGRCYYLTNWQGSTTTLINQTGSTLNATYHYGPYGEGTNWSPADALTGNPFRYTGRRVDPETGLYYYRARYYSPKLGRFLQTDPVGRNSDVNLYTYVFNDALNRYDPIGNDALWVMDITKAQPGGDAQLVIPVHFVGAGATDEFVNAVTERAAQLRTPIDNLSVRIVPTDKPIQGVLNTMDISPGYDNENYKEGEGINKIGGNQGHINSSSPDAVGAALHDIQHFAGAPEGYVEGERDERGRRTSIPAPGYDENDIMATRAGLNLTQKDIAAIKHNATTKVCKAATGTRILSCE